jgi:hypothetical protein
MNAKNYILINEQTKKYQYNKASIDYKNIYLILFWCQIELYLINDIYKDINTHECINNGESIYENTFIIELILYHKDIIKYFYDNYESLFEKSSRTVKIFIININKDYKDNCLSKRIRNSSGVPFNTPGNVVNATNQLTIGVVASDLAFRSNGYVGAQDNWLAAIFRLIAAFANGGQANKIFILGRKRLIKKIGRKSMITYKGKLISLTEARKLNTEKFKL